MSTRSFFIQPETHVARLPVVLISGFLGSGKTTLVNGLLADPRLADTAVAVNEYGPAPLDHHLIENGDDGTVLLANGCLCCNISGDLDEAVMRIFTRRDAGNLPRFRRMIIEPSGLADPAPIAQAILRNPIMSRALRLEAIITTVDAAFAEVQLERHPETRKQVMLADRLIVTKSDLAPGVQVRRVMALLRDLNPTAPISRADHGRVNVAEVLPSGFLDPTVVGEDLLFRAAGRRARQGEARAEHGEKALATVLTADEPLRWLALEAWMRDQRIRHGENLLRVKGMVHVIESVGPLIIQGVHHVQHPPVERAVWPSTDRRTRILLITRGLDTSLIAAAWLDALPQLVAAKAAAIA